MRKHPSDLRSLLMHQARLKALGRASSNGMHALATAGTVTHEQFPHGIRCGACLKVIPMGQPYCSQAEGFIDDHEVITLVCYRCSVTPKKPSWIETFRVFLKSLDSRPGPADRKGNHGPL